MKFPSPHTQITYSYEPNVHFRNTIMDGASILAFVQADLQGRPTGMQRSLVILQHVERLLRGYCLYMRFFGWY